MSLRFWPFVVVPLVGCCVGTGVSPAAEPTDDEARLTKELGGADADRVLTYLRGQLQTEETKKKLIALIEQMGSPTFRTRQEASKKVVEMGYVALPMLRSATSNSDKEIVARAKRCISEIQQGPRYDLPVVAIRRLAKLKEQRAVDVMLAFLPSVADEPFHADILEALAGIGVSGQTVHPALKKALDDPLLRPAAVQLLLKSADPAIVKNIKTYLTDKDPAVRFHVAMHLLGKNDRAAVPVLVGVIADAPNAVIWQQAEEALYAMAGDLAPAVEAKSGSAEDRKAISEQWAAWWRQKGDQVLLGRADDYPTDVAAVAETGQRMRVFEWRPEGKPRFDIRDLNSPVDVRVLPGKRVLIAEQTGRRVSERDFNGKILWEQSFDDGPVSVMRLPNGNTFVATMQRVLEVRRDGEIVYSFPCDPNTSISDANKLTDGRIAIISTDNEVQFMDAHGKIIKRAEADSQGALEALPNGHVLVSQTTTGRITEFDAKGDKVLDLKIDGAWMATRLPDGNMLVASKTKRKMTKIDSKGKVIDEHDVDALPHSLHHR